MNKDLLLKFANTPIGRRYFGVPERKQVVRITEGSVHYLTGELSKRNGLPVICAMGSPGGADVKRVKWLLKLCPGIVELALLGIKHPAVWLMADTGYKSPAATGGTFNEFTNPTNAYSSNDVYAIVTTSDNTTKRQSYETFGFGIPAGATINGIEAGVEGKYAGDLPYEQFARWYCTSDVALGSKNIGFTTTEGVKTLGGATDLWGRTPIDTDFSDANFQFRVQFTADEAESSNISLDHIQVKVYYTAPKLNPAFLLNMIT